MTVLNPNTLRGLTIERSLDLMTDAFVLLDRDWTIVYANQRTAQVVNRSVEQIIGQNHWQEFPGLEGTEVYQRYTFAVQSGQSQHFDFYYPALEAWYEIHAYPSELGLAIYFRQVNERKLAESALKSVTESARRTERAYLAALSNTPDLVYVFDLNHRFTYANQALLTMWGRTFEDAIGKNCLELGYPDWHAAMHDREIEQVVATRQPIKGEVPFTGTHGRRIYEYIFVPVIGANGDVESIAGTTRDVTENRAAGEIVLKERQRLAELFHQAPVFIAVLRGPEHIIELTNRQYQELIGNRNVLGSSVRDALPETVEQGFVGLLDRVYQSGEPFLGHNILVRLSRTPGQPLEDRYLDFVYQPMRAPDGSMSAIMVLGVDVTERRRAEQALRESEARLSAIYSGTFEYIGLLAPDGKLLEANRASLMFAGNTREEVIGMNFWESPWFKYTPGAPELLKEAITRAADGEFVRYEAPLQRPNGEVVTFDFSLHPVRDDSGKVVYLVPEGRDITDLKRVEAALMQSEKLAAVGRLSASIAHEINNPLESVTNLLYLIERSPDLPANLCDLTRMAQQELARVTQIATQTLRFYRQSTARKETSLSDLLDSVLKLFQGRLTSAGVQVRRDYRNAKPLLCFEGELRQVFTNLIGNALDASRNGGQIILRSSDATDWRTGRKGVRVTVADSGHGMSREVASHIFEPFFSTKGMTGTGLGLWVSLEIMQKHEGVIRVRSNNSTTRHGTVFTLFFPG